MCIYCDNTTIPVNVTAIIQPSGIIMVICAIIYNNVSVSMNLCQHSTHVYPLSNSKQQSRQYKFKNTAHVHSCKHHTCHLKMTTPKVTSTMLIWPSYNSRIIHITTLSVSLSCGILCAISSQVLRSHSPFYNCSLCCSHLKKCTVCRLHGTIF